MTIGLRFFDAGQSVQSVCEYVVAEVLRLDNQVFVETVYRNVVGESASPEARAYYVGLLQGSGGNMTQGELLALAAGCDENAVNIELVGLQDAGLLFG